MKVFKITAIGTLVLLLTTGFGIMAQGGKMPEKLRIGTKLSISDMTPEKLAEVKAAGISCVETSFGTLFNKDTRSFTLSDEEIIRRVKQAKLDADLAGVEIWSIHMPFSQFIDLSLADEQKRQKTVKIHTKGVEFCSILKPKYVLFHPSWHLNLNERELRKTQFIKSVTELNAVVKKIQSTMVIENMLGTELLLANCKRERPLFRTVEEAVELMGRIPEDVYSAIDLNHIKNPENLILAMGARLKTLHVADGDGLDERHYFPCSGQGQNNWTAILAALDKVNYNGPFMFESAYKDLKDLATCYQSLYTSFISNK